MTRPLDTLDFIVAILGFSIGLAVGYYLWRNRKSNKQAESRLTKLQIVGVILFIVYIASPLANLPKPDSVIAIGILSLVAGENIGAAVAKFLEKTPYVDSRKKK